MKPKVKHCSGCGARIRWATTMLKGKRIPLNAEPDPKGNIALHGYMAEYVRDGHTGTRYMPHWATCPKAEEFRK